MHYSPAQTALLATILCNSCMLSLHLTPIAAQDGQKFRGGDLHLLQVLALLLLPSPQCFTMVLLSSPLIVVLSLQFCHLLLLSSTF